MDYTVCVLGLLVMVGMMAGEALAVPPVPVVIDEGGVSCLLKALCVVREVVLLDS